MINLQYMPLIADIVALAIVILSLVGYHRYLFLLERKRPTAVLKRVASDSRTAWVESIMSTEGSSILAVQTIRNSTMSASLLASTAVLLMIGVLNLSGQSTSLSSTWHALNFVGAANTQLWLLKLLCILFLLFFAFFCFTNALRLFNHVGYMISARKGQTHYFLTPAQIALELNRAGHYYSLGFRAFYYVIPLVFWLFNPVFMVIAVMVLVFGLLPRIDLTPGEFEYPS